MEMIIVPNSKQVGSSNHDNQEFKSKIKKDEKSLKFADIIDELMND